MIIDHDLIRPEFAMVHRVSEDAESQVFKSRFMGWDDVIGVDFTRTAASVARTGADLNKWARSQETKVRKSKAQGLPFMRVVF